MSEMIKNSDVEDVLFSIRRLVTDTSDAKASAEATADADEKAGALILTSALRVNDPATEPEQVDLEDMTKDLSHFRDAIGRDEASFDDYRSLDEVFAEKSDATQTRRLHLSEVAEDDLNDNGDAPIAVVDSVTPTAEEYFEDEDTGDFSIHKWTGDPDVETLSDFATPSDTFGNPNAQNMDTKPAILTADLIADDWLKDAANETSYSPGVEATVEATFDEEASDFADEPSIEVSEDVSPEQTPGAVDDIHDVAEELEAGATDGLADFDENILDEDALRDMVTEIVRDELSGDLGERITRNVRKLVRREIHRALMTREFD